MRTPRVERASSSPSASASRPVEKLALVSRMTGDCGGVVSSRATPTGWLIPPARFHLTSFHFSPLVARRRARHGDAHSRLSRLSRATATGSGARRARGEAEEAQAGLGRASRKSLGG